MIGHTYERDFKSMASINIIQNRPIKASDLTNSHTMFGPNLSSKRVKTVRQNPDRVVMDCVSVLKYFSNYTSL